MTAKEEAEKKVYGLQCQTEKLKQHSAKLTEEIKVLKSQIAIYKSERSQLGKRPEPEETVDQ